jgi:hypothetical protein
MEGEAERVVFDCVVYAQAIINPDGPAGKCLELAREGSLSLCTSDYLLGEIRELPGKLSPRLKVTATKVEESSYVTWCRSLGTWGACATSLCLQETPMILTTSILH